ncbi:E3 ubiquitin-protein ligase RNF25 [Arapaima gigas]
MFVPSSQRKSQTEMSSRDAPFRWRPGAHAGGGKMAADSDVQSEIEVLKSIYLEELSVGHSDRGEMEVSVVLYPSTAEDSLSQFVRLTLALTLDSKYPSAPPTISIRHPRGLSDDKLLSVQQCLQAEAQLCLGGPALYQLIEKAKEILTESNIPHGNCVICLYGFKEEEVFTKTSCYHYFHSYCLGCYVAHAEAELREREREMEEDKTRETLDDQELTVVCPVCREPLTYDLDNLMASPAPCFPTTEETTVGAEFRKKWKEFQTILERQKERGGVIDPEVESNRFLIHINEAPPDASSTVPASDRPPCQLLPSPPAPDTRCKQHSQQRGARRGVRQSQHEKLTEEQMATLSLSSDREVGVKETTVVRGERELECRLYGGTNVETHDNICQPEGATPWEGPSINSANLDTGSQRGGRVLGRDRGRGRRRGSRSSGLRLRQLQQGSFQGEERWETLRGRGGRGHQGRGGVSAHHRGRGGSRGTGRGFNHKLLQEEDGSEGGVSGKRDMHLCSNAAGNPSSHSVK